MPHYKTLFVLGKLIVVILMSTHLVAQSIETAVFQPGPNDGNDALVKYLTGCSFPADFDNTNYGDFDRLMAMTWTYNSIPESCSLGKLRVFIRFDDIDVLPNNAVVTSAVLYLYGLNSTEIGGEFGNSYPELGGAPPNPIKIGKVSSMWNEQTITWNNQPLIDFSDNIVHGPSTQKYLENISIDVTSIVQNQIAGNNYGIGIQLETEEIYRSWYWASSNSPYTNRRPKLVVKYSMPCDANFNYTYDTAESGFTFNVNNPLPFAQYTWTFGDGTSSTNSLGGPVNHEYYNPGTYTVCLGIKVKPKPCKQCIKICITSDQVSPLSKNEEGSTDNHSYSQDQFYIQNLFPNPALNQITVEIHSIEGAYADLRIYDMMGRNVGNERYSVRKGNQILEFDLPGLEPGIYLCSILIDSHHMEKSFVVQ